MGGSPATQQLNTGIETGGIVEDAIPSSPTPGDFDEVAHVQRIPVEPEDGGQETVRSRREVC